MNTLRATLYIVVLGLTHFTHACAEKKITLHQAIDAGDLDLIIACLKNPDSNVNLQRNDTSPLHRIVASPQLLPAAVYALSRRDIDIDALDEDGFTAFERFLSLTATQQTEDLFWLFIKKGVDVNRLCPGICLFCSIPATHQSPLFACIAQANYVALWMLVKSGKLSLDKKDNHAKTIFDYCDKFAVDSHTEFAWKSHNILTIYSRLIDFFTCSGYKKQALLLASLGVCIIAHDDSAYHTKECALRLDDRYNARKNGVLSTQWLPQLLGWITSLRSKDAQGNSLLHHAATYNHVPAVQCLIEQEHFDVEQQNNVQQTAYDLARGRGHKAAMRLISRYTLLCRFLKTAGLPNEIAQLVARQSFNDR